MAGHLSYTGTFAEVMKLPSDLPNQAWTSGLWFAGVVVYCHRTYAHSSTVFHQTIVVVHVLQNGTQMHMTFDEEVTHVICYGCECHPITIEEIVESLHAAGYDTLLFINTFAWLYRNSIPIVYSNWLKDSNSQGILLDYKDYLV